ncbi:MAG: hypothetical protein H7240_00720 [Glaciimonas sp.]|nr:hypothetical protein [Glaciimonas sp.]
MHGASITLMRDDPALVADAMTILHRTYHKIRQNLFWAFVYNVVGIQLAGLWGIYIRCWWGRPWDSAAYVVSNALLLRRWHPEKNAVRSSTEKVKDNAN